MRRECSSFLNITSDKGPDDCFIGNVIKYHLMNPSEVPWKKCVLIVLGLLMNIPNVAHITMACLGYLSLNHEVQKKIRIEIAENITSIGEIISPDQLKKHVHIKATLMETLRLVSSPYLPHRATEDTLVNGKNFSMID